MITYAKNRALREEMYRAYNNRASAGATDNTPVIERLLALRRESARLLGFDNFAEYSMATKMATLTTAGRLLDDLSAAAMPRAAKELEELRAFAKAKGEAAELQWWDVSYWAERLRAAKYELTEEELKPYLSLPSVLDGMFKVMRVFERFWGVVFVFGGRFRLNNNNTIARIVHPTDNTQHLKTTPNDTTNTQRHPTTPNTQQHPTLNKTARQAPVRRRDRRRRRPGAGVAPRRPLLRGQGVQRHPHRPPLPRPLRAPLGEARRRVDGLCDRPLGAAGPRGAEGQAAGRGGGVQPGAAGGAGGARADDRARRDDAVPRVW